MNKQIIISIGREHGSAGHEIAIRLAEKLNFPVYDKNFFDEISKEKAKGFNKLFRNW
jgi:cytidylate kinase